MGIYQNEEKPPLAHYGVKGMHWGVQKAHTGDLVKPIARLNRVADGKSSLLDKARVVSDTAVYRAPTLLRKGGLKKEAARRSGIVTAHRDRIANGQASVTDLLKAYGSANLISIARSIKD